MTWIDTIGYETAAAPTACSTIAPFATFAPSPRVRPRSPTPTSNRTVLGLGVNADGDILGLSPDGSADPLNWRHR